MHELHLADLLTFTRDGEWGNGEPTEGFSPALVVRGTDFERVRAGNLDTLPLRYIRSDILARKAIAAGDTLIETAGGTKDQPTGRSVFIPASVVGAADLPMVCASFARFLRPDPSRVDPQFLFWKLQDEYHSRRMMPYHVQHTGVARFQYTQFAENYPLFLPPLPEQRAIAATLGALDDKIELNRKMNATLEAMARALFRDWFVDFGPTRAKMAGRAPYLSPDLWSLFPDRLDDEGKPGGWEIGTLNDLAVLNPESWTARNAPTHVRYVDLANTKWGSIDSVEHYAWPDAPSRARRILRAGDTIVGTVRPGNGSFCYVGEDGLTGSTGFAVLRPKNPRDQAFVWCAATSPDNIDRLAHLADGGAYPAVRPDAVAATETVIPGAIVLEAFREAVCDKLDLMEANKSESRTLAQTRDLLLPRLMSGESHIRSHREQT